MQTNEDQRLEALYRETFPDVARMVHQLGGDAATAKDLFHDALIIYLEKHRQHTLQIRLSAKAYLIGITRLLWYKQFRSDCRHTDLGPLEERLTVPEDFYTAPAAAEAPLLRYLKSAGEKCRQLLQAFYYDQLSIPEIATRFGYRSRHSATVQKYKCLEKVREQVKNTIQHEAIIT
ncbi:RNA polymerase sigma factor [Chitinophaga nivalis]|uniref:Sigma-70 family RNA polymerase sigma factor n=1 Tax=Chitinophaga nivalis TaxID=2991709 RepID=A0ABT3IKK6_9BACT|nr:sigma-70 family RNA polymerase sigma factor [Chitinophaga nivalis]MCW3465848.1 sigma-70 family RNA polymerase sigma factor [Chitinophaga nivalis]MCW3484461.1 sigma-70 family RNA polymerase sigma factor [Chitinophaga nivalis]